MKIFRIHSVTPSLGTGSVPRLGVTLCCVRSAGRSSAPLAAARCAHIAGALGAKVDKLVELVDKLGDPGVYRHVWSQVLTIPPYSCMFYVQCNRNI